MKVAALDLGTNTFLCLIADVVDSTITKVYEDQVRIVRLGQDVERTKCFHPEALVRARMALTEFAQIIQQHRPEKVLAMATSAARDVENAEELFAIGKDLNIPIQIIPGSREAEITFRGATSGFNDQKKRLVIDIGGGSTELIVGIGKKYLAGQSLDVGSVRLTERLLIHPPLEKEKLKQIREQISEQVSHVIKTLTGFIGGIDEILAVAGTPTELARIDVGEFSVEKIEGFYLTDKRLETHVEQFASRPVSEIIEQLNVHPGRADVILAGTLILLESMRAAGLRTMKVSTRGVRFGVALDMCPFHY